MFKHWTRNLCLVAFILLLIKLDDRFMKKALTKQSVGIGIVRKISLEPLKTVKTSNSTTKEEEECLSLVSRAKIDLEWICSREEIKFEEDWVQDRFSSEQKQRMSNTGRKIFLEENVLPRRETKNKDLEILIWNQVPERFDRRFLYSYSSTYTNPWGPQCSVHNCRVTHNSSRYDTVSGMKLVSKIYFQLLSNFLHLYSHSKGRCCNFPHAQNQWCEGFSKEKKPQ